MKNRNILQGSTAAMKQRKQVMYYPNHNLTLSKTSKEDFVNKK